MLEPSSTRYVPPAVVANEKPLRRRPRPADPTRRDARLARGSRHVYRPAQLDRRSRFESNGNAAWPCPRRQPVCRTLGDQLHEVDRQAGAGDRGGARDRPRVCARARPRRGGRGGQRPGAHRRRPRPSWPRSRRSAGRRCWSRGMPSSMPRASGSCERALEALRPARHPRQQSRLLPPRRLPRLRPRDVPARCCRGRWSAASR